MRRSVSIALVVLVLGIVAALFSSCWALGVRISRAPLPTTETLAPDIATSTPARPSSAPSPRPPTNTPSPTLAPSPTPSAVLTRTPTPTPAVTYVALDLTEAEVNQIVQRAAASQTQVPITGLYVRLQPDLIVASGTMSLGFLRVDLELLLTVAAEDGQAVPRIADIRTGGRPLTGFLRDQAEALIDPYLRLWLQTETNIYVEEVTVETGRIRMTGRYK